MQTSNPLLPSASEIRRLTPEQRDAILVAAAALAVSDYSNDRALTAFEAFGKEDLHGESSSSESRRDLAG
jgi:hypothetical protein